MRNQVFGLFQLLLLLACLFLAVGSLRAAENTRQKKVKTVSQFGITWKFDKSYPTGQFANGDYWVVGPVTIIGISPPSVVDAKGRTLNGSMINPSPHNKYSQGLDSRAMDFKAALNVARPNQKDLSADNPLIVPVNSSLLSTISLPTGKWTVTKAAAILTVLKSAPPAGSFRPPYSGKDKTIKFNKKQLNYSMLGKLKPVSDTPSMATVERAFERPWPDYMPGWVAAHSYPKDNMPTYGRELSLQVGIGALMLNLNFSNAAKEKLLIRYVQTGIDTYGVTQDGGNENWEPDGGNSGGQKWRIIFAGIMLNDSAMKNIGPGDGAGSVYFGDDSQTFYVTQADLDRVHKPAKEVPVVEYTRADLGLPEWGIRHSTNPTIDNKSMKAPYRRSCTALSWSGYLLAARIMKAKKLWAHNAIFDYQDRYMEMMRDERNGPGWMRCKDSFTANMWDTYRAKLGHVYTGLDKKTHKRKYTAALVNPQSKPRSHGTGRASGKAAGAGASKAARAKARPQPKPLSDAALAPWRKRLVARVKAATRAGKHPRVYLKLFGKKPEKLTLAGSTDAELTLLVQGNKMPWAWDKLDRAGRFQLMRAVADPSRAGDLAALAVWAGAAGQRERAETYLAKARLAMRGKKDPWVAEARALLDALAPAPQKRMGKPANATAPPPSAKIKAKSVTQYGITWHFDREYSVGHFANGDWWVVGPVRVVRVTPKPGPVASDTTRIKNNQFGDHAIEPNTRMRNGSMIVLECSPNQGYDSRLSNYDPALSQKFPLALAPERSLISTISRDNPEAPNLVRQIMWSSEKKVRVVLKTAAVLTCLKKAPPADAFRPAYAGKRKKIYRAAQLQWDRLLRLKRPAAPKDAQLVPGGWSVVERWFERPWLDHMPSWISSRMSPNENQPHYGREWGRTIGIASLLLQLDVPREKKRPLLIRLVQLGIDIQGLTQAKRNWLADGGHWSGRKWPRLFAGLMLREKSMVDSAPGVNFQEDQQTYYGKGWCGQTALFQMVLHHAPRRPYEERPPEKWDEMDKRSEGYRGCCTAQAWIGVALAARLMKAIPQWNHDAFFDYCDRWMSREDPYAAARGKHKRPTAEGKTYDPFVDAMWRTYRPKAPAQPYAGNGLKWVWSGQKGSWRKNPKP